MNRRLVRGGMTSLVVLALAVGVSRRTTDRLAPSPAPAAAPQDPLLPRDAAQYPDLARAFATYRVHEAQDARGIDMSGLQYSSRTTASGGLRFVAGGVSFETRAVALKAADRTVQAGPGTLSKPAFGVTRIDRGDVVEEYVFENRRVEQLFRIPRPVGPGALTVYASVDTDLGGDVIEVPAGNQGWVEYPLQDGGLAFCDRDGAKKVAYHGAVAVDAVGKKQALQPKWEGGMIALHVPESFMKTAVYPVVVDPWLELNFSGSGGGVSITAGVSQTPAMAIDGGGNPFLAWAEQVDVNNFEIYFRYFNGFSWFSLGGSDAAGGVSANPGNSTNPSIAIGPDGSIFIAWQDDTSSNQEIYLRSYDGATNSWVELKESAHGTHGLSASIGESRNPSCAFMQITVPSTGVQRVIPVVAWEDTSSGTLSIHLAAYFPGDEGRTNDTSNDPAMGPIPLALDENFPKIDEGWYGFGTPGTGPGNSYDFFSSGGLSGTPIGAISVRPKLVVKRLGAVWNAWVAWEDTRNNNSEIYSRRYVVPSDALYDRQTIRHPGLNFPVFTGRNLLGGATAGWAATGAGSDTLGGISNSATPSLNVSLAVDAAGKAYVAWEEQLSLTDSDVFESDSTGGAAFTGPTNVSNTAPLPPLTISRSSNASIAVDGSNVYVAWVDDQVGNTEIYVRRRPVAGGAWTEIGFNAFSASINPASTQPVTGVSGTFSASLFPVVQTNGSPVVAWQDFSTGNFEIFLKRFYENEPRKLRQTTPAGAAPVAFGGQTGTATIELRGTLFTENVNRRTRMEVEIKPVSSPFVGTLIQTSGDILALQYDANQESLVEAVISFTGVVNTSYHWRARTVNDLGQTSAWITAGANDDALPDFSVSASPGVPPGAPTGLTLVEVVGGVQAQWTAPVGGADTYVLAQSTTAGLASTGAGSVVANTALTTAIDGSVVAGTTYFYSVAAIRGGLQGPFSVPEATIAFVGGGVAAAGTADSVDKARCGLMGGEALLLLGAAALLRRRRRR